MPRNARTRKSVKYFRGVVKDAKFFTHIFDKTQPRISADTLDRHPICGVSSSPRPILLDPYRPMTWLQAVDRVELRSHYHSPEETAELFTRADFAVLPYRSASASGVLAIAYHYDRPVLVTRVRG